MPKDLLRRYNQPTLCHGLPSWILCRPSIIVLCNIMCRNLFRRFAKQSVRRSLSRGLPLRWSNKNLLNILLQWLIHKSTSKKVCSKMPSWTPRFVCLVLYSFLRVSVFQRLLCRSNNLDLCQTMPIETNKVLCRPGDFKVFSIMFEIILCNSV